MPLTRITDLAYQIDGDLITLEQSTGYGEATMIELHRLHLQHLAEQLNIQSSARLSVQYQQKRALLRLWSKLDLLTSDCYIDEIVERCGDGQTFQVLAFDARNILLDLLEDFGLEVPHEDEPTEAARAEISLHNEKSQAGISVTQASDEPQRGRPSTGQTMTNAERQARHRAKQADLLEATQ